MGDPRVLVLSAFCLRDFARPQTESQDTSPQGYPYILRVMTAQPLI